MKNILLIDGECVLCNRLLHFIMKRNHKKQIYFTSLQSEIGKEMLKKYQYSKKDSNTVLFIEGNYCYDKSTAILRVLTKMRYGWPMLYAMIVIPVSFRDAIYDWVAVNRYRWFGKKENCMLPTPEMKEQWLDHIKKKSSGTE